MAKSFVIKSTAILLSAVDIFETRSECAFAARR